MKHGIYSEQEILQELKFVDPLWQVINENEILKLTRTYQFKTFKEAVDFVSEISKTIDQHNHHPDIKILYNKVNLTLWSHDANGITDRDLNLIKDLADYNS